MRQSCSLKYADSMLRQSVLQMTVTNKVITNHKLHVKSLTCNSAHM